MPLMLREEIEEIGEGEEIHCSCVCGTNCIFIGIVIFCPEMHIFHSDAGAEVVLQNCQVIVASFGCCCS